MCCSILFYSVLFCSIQLYSVLVYIITYTKNNRDPAEGSGIRLPRRETARLAYAMAYIHEHKHKDIDIDKPSMCVILLFCQPIREQFRSQRGSPQGATIRIKEPSGRFPRNVGWRLPDPRFRVQGL